MSFHTHQWREVRRAYAKPPAEFNGQATFELLRQMTFGITSVELVCATCGEIKNTVLLGDLRPRAPEEA